jgi:hypothetical protein
VNIVVTKKDGKILNKDIPSFLKKAQFNLPFKEVGLF